MDPEAALRELLDAVQAGDRDRVSEVADGLTGWLSRGGFSPQTIGPRDLGTVWHIAVTKALIRVAKGHVQFVARQTKQ